MVLARTEQLSQSNAELSGALLTIRESERRIHQDIEEARQFQERMLPTLPMRSGLDLAVHDAPLEE